MSEDQEIPEPPKLPELQLKAGFKKSGSKSEPDSASVPRKPESSALSIDDMLALTKGKSSTAAPPQVSKPASPPAPETEPEPVSQHSVSEAPAPSPFLSNEQPLTLEQTAPPPPPMVYQAPPAFGQIPDKAQRFPKGKVLAGTAIIAILLFALSQFFNQPIKLLIKSKPSEADVYLAGEKLGTTPLEVELDNLSTMPELRKDGYQTQLVPQPKTVDSGKTNKVYAVLKGVPFPLDWSGLKEETRVWWEGTESRPETGLAGNYKVKIKPKGQSSFMFPVKLSWENGQAFAIGKAIANEIKKRPVIKLSLSGSSQAQVIVKDGPRFTHTLTLKDKSSVTLPGPGKYAIKVKKTSQNPAFEKTVEVKPGEKKDVRVSLAVARPQYRPSSPSYNRRPSYTPRQQYRAPAYSGGGGHGRIAPPSF